MKIELWGTYPPPVGGVTIHVKRLLYHLNQSKFVLLRNFKPNKVSCKYIHQVKYPFLEFFSLLFKRKRIIHLHSNNTKAFLLLYLFGIKHKIGVTLHNKRLIHETSFIKRFIIKRFLQKASFIFLNDPQYKALLLENGFGTNKNMHLIPAFIPPGDNERAKIDDSILDFRNRHSFLISANASCLLLENGIDTYGFDLLIELIHELNQKKVNAGLIFCLPQMGNKGYYDLCLNKIKQYQLNDHILIFSNSLSNGFEIWELSDLFIRPTSTDIEGISVKEALLYKTPVIASDVCPRPVSAILFRNRDFDDLLKKTLDVVYKRTECNLQPDHIENPVPRILQIYKEIDK